ncbi:hypothetical protein TNCV_832441 [Trichonephila clavipes]|nr:hypothetical protein TNCV_832441 [Trichonephila clavipes]
MVEDAKLYQLTVKFDDMELWVNYDFAINLPLLCNGQNDVLESLGTNEKNSLSQESFNTKMLKHKKFKIKLKLSDATALRVRAYCAHPSIHDH